MDTKTSPCETAASGANSSHLGVDTGGHVAPTAAEAKTSCGAVLCRIGLFHAVLLASHPVTSALNRGQPPTVGLPTYRTGAGKKGIPTSGLNCGDKRYCLRGLGREVGHSVVLADADDPSPAATSTAARVTADSPPQIGNQRVWS